MFILRNSFFHWPTLLRHFILRVLPFIGLIIFYEKYFGEWSLGVLIVILAAILPFIAIGWLAYQHWKHHG